MAPRDFKTRLARRAAKVGLPGPPDLLEQLERYYELLARWNQKINLTALSDPDEAIDRLLLEPWIASRYLPEGVASLMDVGSGGGSPAIPLKLVRPELTLTMVEVKARKSAFLREAVRHLRLDGTRVETARYEELLARPELHEASDALSLRAVRVEARVLNGLQAFVKPGGVVLLFRGPSGPAQPGTVIPPLEWVGTHPLIDALQSRITILAKRDVGAEFRGGSVPRGTRSPKEAL